MSAYCVTPNGIRVRWRSARKNAKCGRIGQHKPRNRRPHISAGLAAHRRQRNVREMTAHRVRAFEVMLGLIASAASAAAVAITEVDPDVCARLPGHQQE